MTQSVSGSRPVIYGRKSVPLAKGAEQRVSRTSQSTQTRASCLWADRASDAAWLSTDMAMGVMNVVLLMKACSALNCPFGWCGAPADVFSGVRLRRKPGHSHSTDYSSHRRRQLAGSTPAQSPSEPSTPFTLRGWDSRSGVGASGRLTRPAPDRITHVSAWMQRQASRSGHPPA